ncbi:Predicted kinase, aminoglycoside phosphotransferase (APT) family [Epibacterium ulvae]|uniref:Predicted kinase, aminoglycoside phosphotransferase (APT) family n=1 Tax=Epibacterium ulvae TaxID=1156985 RepID=A0A1G5QXC2_9RHOB|nr:aminoglycoside phosphotransferase family protein [Epibacterium ulvae]SCZ66210.1 Predicted kinase, aminoglycoside phosphotransferase (APT) family [Epibacterium ulvae]
MKPEAQAALSESAEQVEARTRAYWPDISKATGLPAEGVRFRPLHVNANVRDRRCVLEARLEDKRRFVLRADYEERRRVPLMKQLQRHRIAAEALRESSKAHVPQVLWEASDTPCALLEFVPGETAVQELQFADLGAVQRDLVWERIGAAIGALHAVSRTREKRFWPKPFLQQVSEQAEAVRRDAGNYPHPQRFLGLCALLHRFGKRARGLPYLGALEHGDMHLCNILIAEEKVSFIDFSNFKNDHPQRDLANLWVTAVVNEEQGLRQGTGYGMIAPSEMRAFEAGYGEALIEDPIFRFFHAYRLFRVWGTIARMEKARGPRVKKKRAALVAVLDSLQDAERTLE